MTGKWTATKTFFETNASWLPELLQSARDFASDTSGRWHQPSASHPAKLWSSLRPPWGYQITSDSKEKKTGVHGETLPNSFFLVAILPNILTCQQNLTNRLREVVLQKCTHAAMPKELMRLKISYPQLLKPPVSDLEKVDAKTSVISKNLLSNIYTSTVEPTHQILFWKKMSYTPEN